MRTTSPRSSNKAPADAGRQIRLAAVLAALAVVAAATAATALPATAGVRPAAPPGFVAAAPADTAGERARRILADRRFQDSAPDAASRQDDGSEGTQDNRGERTQDDRGLAAEPPEPQASPDIQAAAAGGTFLSIVGDGLAVVAAGLAIAWGIQAVARWAERRRGAGGTGQPTQATNGAVPAQGSAAWTPEDAAALAAGGRYDEALHALLLAAIALVARRAQRLLPPSHTSRELITLLPLAGEAQSAFTGLVQAVERSLFGGVPAGAADYAASLQSFHAVTAVTAITAGVGMARSPAG